MDRLHGPPLELKEAVQSRTVFLTEVASWRDVIPLLGPKVQTVGLALGDVEESLAFAESATQAGVARCVRPGIMNNYESPWDGKLLVEPTRPLGDAEAVAVGRVLHAPDAASIRRERWGFRVRASTTAVNI